MNWLNRLFKNQKGVFLVFTAVLLPIIFACAGLAMDLGNAFAHKSKLQNAADAAALAGAKTFAVNKETIDKHPLADAMAVGYANTNYQKEIPEGNRKLQAQTKDEKSYYRVFLKDDVPVTFMRMLGVGPTMEVSVDAIATIPVDVPDPGIDFGELLTVGDGIEGSFNNNNGRDNDQGMSKNPINGVTFDGKVITYNESKYNEYKKNNTYEGWYRFFSSQAAGMARNEAIAKGYYTEPELRTNYESEKNRIEKEMNDLFNLKASDVVKKDADFSIPGNDKLSNYYEIVPNMQKLNVEIHIRDLAAENSLGDKNTPVYIYVKDPSPWQSLQMLKIGVDEKITRPIIIYYPGKQTITFEGGNGGFFRGVICAPNASIAPFNFDNGGKFYGSIWANSVQLQSTNRTEFHFASFGGGSSGEGSIGESVKLKLVDGSGLTWE